jgi:NADPH:quinone reductase-like Zn-dependent oxidoreductase
VWITRQGPPEVLQVKEAPDPQAGAGEVRVAVRAAGINFADLSARMGLYPDAPKIPCVVGYEASGTIDQVGAGVSNFAVGDRVLAMPRFGGYSSSLALPASQVTKMPEAMSFEEGAALPVVYLTAHHMMLFTGNLRLGSKVLIHSAAGGVGLAAIDLARTRDCEIFGTASPGKHDFLRARGVHHPIDSSADCVAAVRKIIGDGGGLDLVLDPVGGPSLKRGYDLLGPCGRLVAFGASSLNAGKTRNLLKAISTLVRFPRFNPINLMNDNKEVAGTNMGHLFDRLDLLQPQVDALIAMYERGQLKPYVDRTFSFDEAAAAHHYIHDRKAKGKVLLVP